MWIEPVSDGPSSVTRARTSSRPRALRVAPKREPVAITGAARVTIP